MIFILTNLSKFVQFMGPFINYVTLTGRGSVQRDTL